MARPQNDRIVQHPPLFTEFKPARIPGKNLKEIKLSLDEYEAFRLVDFEGMTHEEAADSMRISRPTFSRLIEKARQTIAQLIIKGNMLVINGGNIHFKNNILKCLDCEHMFNIDINQSISECPECHSTKLINMAGSFGHGQCCTERHKRHSTSN